MYKEIIKIIFFLSILTTYYIVLATAPAAQAVTMSNQNYILQMDSGDKLQESNVKISQAHESAGPNYTIESGFNDISSVSKFRLTISPSVIDFGALSATNPVTRTQTITIQKGSSHGYSVTASENHGLETNQNSIPNTTCDTGTCSETISASWTSSLTYGFGYSLDGVSFQQLSDASSNKAPAEIISGESDFESQLLYKVNVSTTQPPGGYSNVITYIALPTF